MLLKLTEYLGQFHSGFGVFQYLTLRAILGALTALTISLIVGPSMIRRLSRFQIGQTVRDDGPESHFTKAGTPTMGGSLILVAIATSTLFWSDLSNRFVWVVLIVTLLFGAVGWVDDYKKLVKGDPKGLPARQKYFWQSVIGLGCALFLYYTASIPAETQLIVPFFKDVAIELGWGVRSAHLLRHRRLEQRGQPHRWPGRARDSSHRDGGRGAGHLRLRDRQLFLRQLPRLPVHPGSRRGGGLLRFHCRRRSRVSCGSTLIPPRCSWATSEPSHWARPWVWWRWSHARSWCS